METNSERLAVSAPSFAFCADARKRERLIPCERYLCKISTEYEMVQVHIIAVDVVDLMFQMAKFILSDEDRFGSPDYGSFSYTLA